MTKVHFKDLKKKEVRHLREMGITTLREFKYVAGEQAKQRRDFPFPKFSEPCWDCRAIAKKLELPI